MEAEVDANDYDLCDMSGSLRLLRIIQMLNLFYMPILWIYYMLYGLITIRQEARVPTTLFICFIEHQFIDAATIRMRECDVLFIIRVEE